MFCSFCGLRLKDIYSILSYKNSAICFSCAKVEKEFLQEEIDELKARIITLQSYLDQLNSEITSRNL